MSTKQRSVYVSTLIGAVGVAALIGWWIGTKTSCGDSCQVNVELFGAWGTWVGSLVTVVSVIYLARQVSLDVAEKRKAADEVRASRLALARSCKLKFDYTSQVLDRFKSVTMSFENKTTQPLFDVVIGFQGEQLARAIQISPGARPFGKKVMFEDIGFPDGLPISGTAELFKPIRSDFEFEFTIVTTRFRRINNEVVVVES